MHKPLLAILAALPLVAALPAQMPSPKTAQHEQLKAFVGTWKTESEMAAMPGVPGMEEPSKSSGIETAELVCNGLWLKVTGRGEAMGQQAVGIWLLGADMKPGKFLCVAASNLQESLFQMEGRIDKETGTWHFSGDTPMGPFRSELVWESKDRSVETCFGKGPDGEEMQVMRITRTRMSPDEAAAAQKEMQPIKPAKVEDLPAARQALNAELGTWDADWQLAMPGGAAMKADCKEVVEPICAGRWSWSTFTGNIMGAPFEGHALTGYDGQSGKVISIWIDSMTGPWMLTQGDYDSEVKTFALTGVSYDAIGNKAKVTSTAHAEGKDIRNVELRFGEGDAASVLTIKYTRKK